MVPELVLLLLAFLGTISLAVLGVWLVQQTVYYVRYKKPRPTVEQLQHSAELEALQGHNVRLKSENAELKEKNAHLDKQVQYVLEKLTDRLSE